MKKILLVLSSLLAFNVFAEADLRADYKNHSIMNGLVVGYATYCEFDKENIKKISDFFSAMIEKSSINRSEKEKAISYYVDNIAIGRNVGPKNSEMSCNSFRDEFNLIVKAINEKNAIPKPVIVVDRDSFELMKKKVEEKNKK